LPFQIVPNNLSIQGCNFTYCIVWVWNLVSYITGSA